MAEENTTPDPALQGGADNAGAESTPQLPFWADVAPDITDEASLKAHLSDLRDKAGKVTEYEQQIAEYNNRPYVRREVSREIDDYVETAVANGMDERTAFKKAFDRFNTATEDWSKRGGFESSEDDKVATLAEKMYLEHDGAIPRHECMKAVRAEYGLDEKLKKPWGMTEDQWEEAKSEAEAEYNAKRESKLRLLGSAALRAAGELSKQAEKLKLHPYEAEQRNRMAQRDETMKAVAGDIEKTVKSVRSLEVEVSGIKINLEVTDEANSRVMAHAKANPQDFLDPRGKVDPDKVRELQLQASMLGKNNFMKALEAVAREASSRSAKEAASAERGGRVGNNGAELGGSGQPVDFNERIARRLKEGTLIVN